MHQGLIGSFRHNYVTVCMQSYFFSLYNLLRVRKCGYNLISDKTLEMNSVNLKY